MVDGFNFMDHGVVLDHRKKAVWDFRDELFPIIAFQANGKWYVYYIPNGTRQKGKLGVAWGSGRENLRNTGPAIANGKTIKLYGSGGFAKIGTDTYALFLNKGMEVRTVHLDYPDRLSKIIQRYEFDKLTQGTVFLDDETNIWYMFYRVKKREDIT